MMDDAVGHANSSVRFRRYTGSRKAPSHRRLSLPRCKLQVTPLQPSRSRPPRSGSATMRKSMRSGRRRDNNNKTMGQNRATEGLLGFRGRTGGCVLGKGNPVPSAARPRLPVPTAGSRSSSRRSNGDEDG
nr:uncharacterized protein LOC112289909 [Physcomitrium patens]|eukprot:XP_024391399.1 uncharacterized protein LOC112289909 [Physcomitrella patens]